MIHVDSIFDFMRISKNLVLENMCTRKGARKRLGVSGQALDKGGGV